MAEAKFLDSTNVTRSSATTTSERHDQDHWYGQLPCGYDDNNGCLVHNPTLQPIYSNPLLKVPKSTRRHLPVISAVHGRLRHLASPDEKVLDSSKSVAGDDEVKSSLIDMGSLFSSNLPFDTASTLALEPMLPAMSYRLAYYHLDYARQHLCSDNDDTFIPELSCSDRSLSGAGRPPFEWSSEVYNNKGSFLQRQEIRCALDEGQSRCPSLEIRVCHHKRAYFSGWKLRNNNGQLDVSVRVSFFPFRKNNEPPYTWKNARGANLARLHVCTRCQCDFEYNVEVAGRQVIIRFACYRDLGTAKDRFEPQWRSHLTDKGLMTRRKSPWYEGYNGRPHRSDSPSNYQLYRRVWQTAKRLDRPNLHLTTFETTKGEFQSTS